MAGLLLGSLFFQGPEAIPESEAQQNAKDQAVWTCSMHPQIRKSEPGDCPICGMDLVPLEAGAEVLDAQAVSMSPTAMQLAQVQTLTVGSAQLAKSIRLNGKVQIDERRLFTQSSHIEGRIENLNVNFTGELIKAGQVIAYVYSPELVTAQEELLEAEKMMASQPVLFSAAKERLKRWKLSNAQIDRVLTSGMAIEQFPVLANVSGYVIKKLVNLGDYVKQGAPLFQVADYTKVWVMFDVYEKDIKWVEEGDSVRINVAAVPSETFKGVIGYIDPEIDPKTRTAKARVELQNTDLKLKPEMFVTGVVKADRSTEKASITVPKSAVMWTGKRSLVYVMQQDAKGVSFMMREVVLGPDLGDHFAIESGLVKGEEIAVNGTFSIDAAAQLAGKPSMMSQNSKAATDLPLVADHLDVPDEVKQAMKPLFTHYFALKTALANDDLPEAQKARKDLGQHLQQMDMKMFTGEAHKAWMAQSAQLQDVLQQVGQKPDLSALRQGFINISSIMIKIENTYNVLEEKVYLQHCPMADQDKGANWLSSEKEIRNPYFGQSMLTCGSIMDTLD